MASAYPQPPESYEPLSAQSSTMATISLISGIISWFLLPVIGGIIAVITGHMAKREIRESMGRLTGDGMATAGLVLGYLNLGVTVLSICAVVVLIALGVPFLCIPFANEFSRLLGPFFGM
jgi:Domain of unknown function (DUF4190)